MSFFSWMRGARQQHNHSQSTQAKPAGQSRRQSHLPTEYYPMDPSTIADAVIVLRKENDRANELCAKADLVINGQEHELLRLRDSNKFLETRNKNLETSNKNLKAAVRGLEATLREYNAKSQSSTHFLQIKRLLKAEQEKCKGMQNEILEARLVNRSIQYQDLYHVEDATPDATGTMLSHVDVRPAPFVVVLVDGDSYRPSLEKTASSDVQGRDMAHKLNREVSKYILSHPHIPPHSRIVVRFFCNRSSMRGRMVKSSKKGNQLSPNADVDRHPIIEVETMVKFAETYPLFDYLDCGGGKERVDDKIRENCHLYMADSNCHTVFLAVCNDNGYVRMLERYEGNAIPGRKIVLLTNGSITPDMEKLSFPKVAFNGIFKDQYQRKIRQGSSGHMGPVIDLTSLPDHQTASDYDLDYTDSNIRKRIETTLQEIRQKKKQKTIEISLFARLTYETNERYEERLRALLPLSRPSLSHGRGYSRSVANVGLRRARPAGILLTAPILPFILHSEPVQNIPVLPVVGGDSSLD